MFFDQIPFNPMIFLYGIFYFNILIYIITPIIYLQPSIKNNEHTNLRTLIYAH